MGDRPIIFSAPMVRALLAGRKTQTRRLATSPLRRCESGDRLWVRESFRAEELSRPPSKRLATARERLASERTHAVVLDELDGADGIRYAADDEWVRIANTVDAGEKWTAAFHYGCRNGARPAGMTGKLIPSIHMPRWASRLTLIVEALRVELLQAITWDDARAEGLTGLSKDGVLVKYGIPDRDGLPGSDDNGWHWQEWNVDPTAAYGRLWSSLHTKPGERWEDNPMVVALTFRVEQRNIDAEQPHAR